MDGKNYFYATEKIPHERIQKLINLYATLRNLDIQKPEKTESIAGIIMRKK